MVPLLSLVLEGLNFLASCFIPVIKIHMTFQLFQLLEIIQLKFESIAQESVSKDSYKCPQSPVTVQAQIVGVFLGASAALLL